MMREEQALGQYRLERTNEALDKAKPLMSGFGSLTIPSGHPTPW